ncbi:MAG: ExbD/TolR family protein [Vulcanimicrobiota bacterium]
MIKTARKKHINNEISITNLIDILFVLLVIIMITASTFMHTQKDIVTPKAQAESKTATQLQIQIDRNNIIFWAGASLTPKQLQQKLKTLVPAQKKQVIVLKADGQTSYGKILEVMKILENEGFSQIFLSTRREELICTP